MTRFNILHPLYMSFYSRELYRDVAANWGGRVFWYLFLLLALCWIPVMGVSKSVVTSYITYEAPRLVRQFPPIEISSGIATVDAQMPYTITDPEKGTPLIILDTTGQTGSLVESDAVILLMKDKVVLKKGTDETSSYDLKDFGDFSIDQVGITGSLERFDKWFVFVFYPIALFMSYIYRLLQALFFGFIGKFYNKSIGARLDYQALCRIATVGLTPAILLNTMHIVTRSNVPGWGLICFFISIAYLYYGVVANVEELPPTGEK